MGCAHCGRALAGKQTRFCSGACKHKAYLRRRRGIPENHLPTNGKRGPLSLTASPLSHSARKERQRLADQKKHRNLKLAALDAYGGRRCACCGETEIAFLTLDHVDGGGHRQRTTERLFGSRFYRWLKQNGWPDIGLQVLCANCNMAKAHGVCPHQHLTLLREVV